MNGQPNAQGTTSAPPCDVYDVAHLTGGLARVVDTAVVVLLEDGRLKADGTGRLQAEGRATHPVEAAVLDLAGPRAQRSVQTLRVRAEDDPRLTAVADRLVAAGLLRRNPLAGLRSGRPTHRRTSAARQVLRQWATTPPAGIRGVDVALGGAPRTADPVLGQLVFGSLRPSAARRAGRRAAAGDPGSSTWLYAGWGGGGDGGGWGGGWGGDGGGGGCGGGDGGGGGC